MLCLEVSQQKCYASVDKKKNSYKIKVVRNVSESVWDS